jgi:hypothetical protein
MKLEIPELDAAVAAEVSAADDVQQAEIAKGTFSNEALAEREGEFEGVLKKAVDVYTGPEGIGYVVRFVLEMNGETWSRCEARGPETYRTTPWEKMVHPKPELSASEVAEIEVSKK